MRRLLPLSSLTCALCLAGCAEHWNQAGASREDFYRDNSQCLALSQGPSAQVAAGSDPATVGWNRGQAYMSAYAADQIYQQCMLGRGWRHGSY